MTDLKEQAATTIPQPARARTAGEPTSRSYPRAQPVDNWERRVRNWPCVWGFEDGRLLARNTGVVSRNPGNFRQSKQSSIQPPSGGLTPNRPCQACSAL